MKLGKLEVVRRQTEAGIRMLLDGTDPLAVITIAHAADEMLMALTSKRPDSMRKTMLALAVGDRDAFLKEHNRVYNFLKHASSDPTEETEAPSERHADGLLACACMCYEDLTGAHTPTMAAFVHWYVLLHPEIAKAETPERERAMGSGGEALRQLPREGQLAWCKKLVDTFVAKSKVAAT